MGFWRTEVIDFALDQDTDKLEAEQRAWIASEPDNPKPYYHLAQFCRARGKTDAARGLLLHAVSLKPAYADAHLTLAEMYAVQGDYGAAWRHAIIAAENGRDEAAIMLRRHGIRNPASS